MSEHDPLLGLPVLGVSPDMGTLPRLGNSPLLGRLHELGKQERVPPPMAFRASVDPQRVLFVMLMFFVLLLPSLFLFLSLHLSPLSLFLSCSEGRSALASTHSLETGVWVTLPAAPWLQ